MSTATQSHAYTLSEAFFVSFVMRTVQPEDDAAVDAPQQAAPAQETDATTT